MAEAGQKCTRSRSKLKSEHEREIGAKVRRLESQAVQRKSGRKRKESEEYEPENEDTDTSDCSEPSKKRSKVRKLLPACPERIITWRWNKRQKCREYLVKYKNMNMFQTEWVEHEEMQKLSRYILTMYTKKNDMDEEPKRMIITEDDPNSQRIERMAPDFDMFTDHLQEEFYQYGVYPEELIVHRVLDHRTTNNNTIEYFVKWRGMDYSKCTWEVFDTNIPQLETSIDYYNQHRCYRLGLEIPKVKTDTKLFIPPSKPLTDLETQLAVQPKSVNETGLNLYSYQLDGLNWLRLQYKRKIPCILADEMGLGKTIQTSTFLYSLFKEGHSTGPFLIVCPLSTMINWERELELWAPDFYNVSYLCLKPFDKIIHENDFSFEKGQNKYKNVKFHVMVTSYEAIIKNKRILSCIDWEVIVVDEAQRLKNSQANFFKDLSRFTPKAFKLLLTGTPLQNNLVELFSLLNYMDPKKFDDETSFTEEFAEISKEEQVMKLQSLLADHMLRRVKADVFKNEIPPKTELIVQVELTAEQKCLYKCILEKQLDKLNSDFTQFSYGRMTASATFMHLRKLCNHPYLFPRPREEACYNKKGCYEQKALLAVSGKFQLLEKMLPKLKKQGHRVLMFSQMTRLLDVLEDFLTNMNYQFERIDGQVSVNQRQQAIDRFNAPNSESFVFLLSTRAGGLGINLATADTVIVFDSDWNPHNDIQALARAHRIGQRKKVMIYRLVCRGSIEERMIEVTKKKLMLTTLVVRNNSNEKVLSEKEIEEIVRFGTEKLFASNSADEVTYDDAAIDQLLDRDSYADDEDNKENQLTNEFLASFKLASLAGPKEARKKVAIATFDVNHNKNI